MKIENNRVIVDPPKRPKKITGTRFASILGLDRWNTPFKTWCAITKTYEEPFIDNQYTLAGKAIEPIIIKYLNKMVFFGDLVSATQHYGGDPFLKTFGDFYKSVPIFGGMWDAYEADGGKTKAAIIEIKTTKRAEDWLNGAPEYYALQAALYAWLEKVDQVYMVCGLLEESDYEHPENFVPTSNNIIVERFLVSERFPQFAEHYERATCWWNDHVLTGISPEFDEKKDAEILKAIRTNKVTDTEDIGALLARAESLEKQLDAVSEIEKQLKEVRDAIKTMMQAQLRDTDNMVEVTGGNRIWTLTRGSTNSIDKNLLKADGLLEKYTVSSVSYTLRNKMKEENK